MRPDLLHVPAFSRLTDWCGAWGIEETAGYRLLTRVRQTDLVSHIARAERKAVDPSYSVQREGKQGIAVIMLTGVLMKSIPSMEQGTSTIEARRALRKAAADPEVDAILLAIESPGGTVAGTFDLAADVKAAAKSKPVWAQIEDLGASAAYAAASQADKIFANNLTCEVGCIGTVLAVYDESEAAANDGVKVHVFKTGPLKGAGIPGTVVTDEHQQHFQQRVDEAQKSFDAAVQKGRGLTDKQLEAVKTGGVFGAQEAIRLKLIDGIQSFDQTVTALAAEARRQKRTDSRAAGPGPQRSSAMTETEIPTAGATEAGDDTLKAQRVAAAADLRRIAGIYKVAAKHPDIAADAIEQGWSVEKTELAAMKADLKSSPVRTANPAHFNIGGTRKYADGVSPNAVLEAAVRMSLGSRNLEKEYKAEVLEAAHSHHRGIGLQQVFLMAAAEAGYPCSPGEKITQSNLADVLHAVLPSGKGRTNIERAAATSTVSLPGILGNVANKELLAGYMEGDESWREISRVVPAGNFQTRTFYRMLDNMEYEEVGPDGKIKHGSTAEESFTATLKTYAKMFALTRQAIINDDLGAFQDLRTRLGRGAKKKFNNLFWTNMLADHSTFFTAARTNYISGATTNLGTDGVGLGLGVKAFRGMTSPSADGAKRVGGNPEVLLVPPELEAIARVLYIANNGTSVKASDVNIYTNQYRPVVVTWLSDSAFTGYSTTAWYLMRNPADLAMMYVSFLNGQQNPTIDTAEADFDTLGVQFRGFHDFYANQAEYLCGVKSKGAA